MLLYRILNDMKAGCRGSSIQNLFYLSLQSLSDLSNWRMRGSISPLSFTTLCLSDSSLISIGGLSILSCLVVSQLNEIGDVEEISCRK